MGRYIGDYLFYDYTYSINAYWHSRCAVCGIPYNRFGFRNPDGTVNEQSLNYDHIVAKKKGGGSTINNIIPLCRKCNTRKGQKSLMEWLTIRYGKRFARYKCAQVEIYLEFICDEDNHPMKFPAIDWQALPYAS